MPCLPRRAAQHHDCHGGERAGPLGELILLRTTAGSKSHPFAPRHPCPQCLHRFCSECIQKCLRVGRKECPSCRIHVPSRRSLRYDTNFDAVIGKIYPNLDE